MRRAGRGRSAFSTACAPGHVRVGARLRYSTPEAAASTQNTGTPKTITDQKRTIEEHNNNNKEQGLYVYYTQYTW